jgi:hypothetical protein
MFSHLARLVAKVAAAFSKTLPTLGGTSVYRPEKYYMRGPGPQWHAKHGRMR